jgi:hypothetical protein
MKDINYVWVVENQNVLADYRYDPFLPHVYNSRKQARDAARAHNEKFKNKARVIKYFSEKNVTFTYKGW